MTAIRSYRDLDVWKRGMQLTTLVYRLTASFPSSERFGLVPQLQRSAVSVPSNIAEGHQRDSTRDFSRFLSIGQGSLAELETQLILAAELGLAGRADIDPLLATCAELGRMLNGMQSKLRQRLSPLPRPPAPDL